MEIPDLDLNLLDHPDEVPRFLAWLADVLDSGQPISIDTETGSVHDLYVDRPQFCRLWQVGTADSGWALGAVEWHALIGHAMRLIASANNTVVFANCKYDQHVFQGEGWATIPWHRVEDVIILHRLTRWHQQFHGLKPACVEEFGDWAGAGQAELKSAMAENGWSWATIPITEPTYWVYGIMDVCLTVRLWEALPSHPWYPVEQQYQALCFGMETRGLHVDSDNLSHATATWEADLEEQRKHLAVLGFDKPSSSTTVDQVFRSLGHDPAIRAETGNPIYDRQVMTYLQTLGGPVGEAAEHLVKYRRASKWASTYGHAVRDQVESQGNTNIRFTVNTMGARTGRSSVSSPGPALQTVPKDQLARSVYRAPKGAHLWAVDYSSQEIVVQASLSGDPAMIAFFSEGDGDYHQYVADLASIPRKVAKTCNYARAYGSGVDKLAATAGVGQDQMKVYLRQIDSAFPEAIRWKNTVTALAEQEDISHVVLPYGRHVLLEEGNEYTTAANSIIQGHGADVLKLAACRLASAGFEDNLVLPVHDELLFAFEKGDESSPHRAAEIMVDTHLRLPLTVDVTGPASDWGQTLEES